MGNPSPSPSHRSSTTLTDLDMDTLTRCASYLSLRDISNMAMSCKYLNTLLTLILYGNHFTGRNGRKSYLCGLIKYQASGRLICLGILLCISLNISILYFSTYSQLENLHTTYCLTGTPLFYRRVHQYIR